MSNIITSTDLLMNKKNTPDENSEEYFDFWAYERDKCKNGITIDNVYISGFLYYHLNFFKCQLDILENGRIIRKLANPYLRDNEWLIDEYIRKAEDVKKGLCILGSRRLAKSVYEASYITHRSTFYKGTQNVIAGLNEPDIKIITDLCEEALGNLPNAFRHGRIEDNWKKQVTFGKKTISGERTSWSSIPIRNLDGGKNTEALAGLSPFSMVIDEIGKGDWLAAFSAAIPGFATPFGWRCSPLAFGTSGDMTKANDAKLVFDSPEAYNFLAVEVPDEPEKKTSVFISGHYAHDFPKDDTPLNKYLNIPVEKAPNISNVNIKVTNFDKAEKMIDEEREQASKSDDNTAVLKLTMYHPKNRLELFLTESNNKFNREAIEQHQLWLKEHYEPIKVELYRDLQGKVQWKYSDIKPIFKFPIRPTDEKNAPLCIYEFPIPDAPRFTYCIGIDPVNNNDSNDNVISLFTIKVFKRMISPMDEFKDEIVASFRGRYKELSEMHELALLIAEFYNAVEGVLPEASEASLIQYFFLKKKGNFLADSFDLQTEIAKKPIRGSGKKKGLPATTVNQRHYMNLMVEYANKEIIEINEDGDEEYKYGVFKIKDYMLLEEMKSYRGKTSGKGVHDGNFDSVISFGCALTLASYYDIKYPIAQYLTYNKEEQRPYRKKSIQTPFGMIEFKPKFKSMMEEEPKHKIPRWMKGKRF
jgi:hypothetical protein